MVTPTDSPSSDYIAEIVLLKLEATTYKTLEPSFWIRYVNDTFPITKSRRQADC